MATIVLMPQIGQDIETGIIIQWNAEVNTEVHKGDVIAIVESEKAQFDVTANHSGVLLKQLYEAGDTVQVLTPIGYIGEPGEEIDDSDFASERENTGHAIRQERSGHSIASDASTPDIQASPKVRKLAKDNGIDLNDVQGTGPSGRIVEEDVLRIIEKG